MKPKTPETYSTNISTVKRDLTKFISNATKGRSSILVPGTSGRNFKQSNTSTQPPANSRMKRS